MGDFLRTGHRFFKIAIIANPHLGSSSFSSRLSHALASKGHTPYFFSPSHYPDFFNGEGFDLNRIGRLSEVQFLDLVIFADGILPMSETYSLNGSTAVGALIEDSAQVRKYGRYAFDFHICVGDAVYSEASAPQKDTPVFKCTPMPDKALVEATLGNPHIQSSQIICVQDATEERVGFLRDLACYDNLSITCFGGGWPAEWSVNIRAEQENAFAYRVGANSICVVFDGEGGAAENGALCQAQVPESVLALLRIKGCDLFYVDADGFNSNLAGGKDDANAKLRDPEPSEGLEGICAKDADSVPNTVQGALEGARLAGDCGNASSRKYLDEELPELLERMQATLSLTGKMQGGCEPRKTASVLGYVGIGNFGDEYILKTIDERMRLRVGGASVIAVCERPCRVIETHGIFAVNLADKFYLDRLLEDSAVALVMAGLLFDQGIALTMGVAELFSSAPYTDLPGIASYILLARMRGAKPIFYGIGAGPLDVGDSKALVRLMAGNGSVFLTRDQHSADAIEDCGVAKEKVTVYADVAFLGNHGRAEALDGWLESAGIEENENIFAVSLREYPGCGPDFAERIAAALDRIADGNDVTMVFCLLDPSDEDISRRVAGMMDAKSLIFDPRGDIDGICGLLGMAKAGLSMRYHASVILNKCGHPSVGLGYLPKVVSLYDCIGANALLCAMDDTADTIASKMQDMLSNLAFWEDVVTKGANRQRLLAQKAEDAVIESLTGSSNGSHGGETLFLFDRSSTNREIDDLKAKCSITESDLMMSRDLLDYERSLQKKDGSVGHAAKSIVKRAIRRLAQSRRFG